MYKRRKEGGRVSRGGEKECKIRGRRKYEANEEEEKEGTSKKRREERDEEDEEEVEDEEEKKKKLEAQTPE